MAPAPAPTSTQAAAPAGAPAVAGIEWLKDADEITVGYAQNKGWKSPADVLTSYQNLEKLLGADKAGNAIIIPKADADPKEWSAVFDRMGRPSAPDGYKVDVPEGGDPKVWEAASGKFHELGLTKTQGEALAKWWNDANVTARAAQEQQQAEDFKLQDQQLRAEWGQAHTQNVAKAQIGMRTAGWDAATVDKVSAAIGHKATMNLLAKIGAGAAESDFEGGNGGVNGAMTPGQAQARIAELRSDKDWVRDYTSGNKEKLAEMKRLMAFAYPDQSA